MEGTAAQTQVRTRPVEQDELPQLIRRIPILSRLKEEDLGCLGQVQLMEAPAGTVLVQQGQSVPGFCMILEGEIRAVRMEMNGSETPLAVYQDGEAFGEAPLLLGYKKAGVQCVVTRDVRALVVNEEGFWG